MKKLFALSFCVCFFLGVGAYAHPGGTDSQGGHRVSATGEYHYHHGRSAHQHSDMDGDGALDCPYDSVETPKPTEKRVDTPTRQAAISPPKYKTPSSSPLLPKTSPTPTVKPKQGAEKPQGNSAWVKILIALPIVVLTGRGLAALCADGPSTNESQRRMLSAQKNAAQDKPGGAEFIATVSIPKGSYIGADGLPASKGKGKWGSKYTFYASPKGQKYHREYGCSGAHIPINISRLANRQPCRICKPVAPRIDWYWEYKRNEQIKKD